LSAESDRPELESLLSSHEPQRPSLIPILQNVQDRLGYLSKEAVAGVAEYLHLSENDVYGVATFYTQFRFTPPGRHCVKVCTGTACHVRGSEAIMREVGTKLGVAPGETTPDGEYSLERVACFGSCALAPVVVIDDKVHGQVLATKTEELLSEK
jgi:NADH-quinone oxidoreductase subunit E